MVIAIALAILVPVLGYKVGRMPNINTGTKPSIREGIYSAAGWLGFLGCGSFVLWFIVWMWSMRLDTPPTWINMSVWLAYSIIAVAIGGLTMAATRPRC